jgi:lipopolysaccharide transport system ATP-binding protein
MGDAAVHVEGLGKLYKVYPDSRARVVEWITGGRLLRHSEKWALRDVSFTLERGRSLGVVGSNGAGKSTLLKILTGTTRPTTGTYRVTGCLGSLLELGAGFHPDFSGRDNIFMNAAVLGVPRREVRERFDELADFAELGEYLERPVRTYSSGMTMRLAFATALLAKPDVLILDEVLAVGDAYFQKKCMDRIRAIRKGGAAVLFVSHSIYHVRQICDEALWLHDGSVVERGDPTSVTDHYVNWTLAMAAGRSVELERGRESLADPALPHLGPILICRPESREPATSFATGEEMEIQVHVVNPGGRGALHVGLLVHRNDDLLVFATRSREHGRLATGEEDVLVVRVPVQMMAGEYSVSAYLLDESCDHILDQRVSWTRFQVSYEGIEKGVVLIPVRWLAPERTPR